MPILGMLTRSVANVANGGGTRYVLLALLLVAVILLLTGAAIAIVTWRGQRKGRQEKQLEREYF